MWQGLALVAHIVLGDPGACPFNAVCSMSNTGPATTTLMLSMTLKSASEVAYNVELVDPKVAGVYRATVRSLTVGIPEARDATETYLVLVDTATQPVYFVQVDGFVTVAAPEGAWVRRLPAGDDGERVVRAVLKARRKMVVGWLSSGIVQKVLRAYSEG